MDDDELRKLATFWVCPNTGIATTEYEVEAINNLIGFGQLLLKNSYLENICRKVEVELCDCGEPFPEGGYSDGYCRFCGAHSRYLYT